MVQGPGVVTGRYGTIGEVFFLEEPFWPLNTTLFVRDFHGNEPQFVFYMLQRFDFKTFSGKSGVPGVNRNELHRETVSLPSSTGEQRAIATALSDVDALLGGLDRLIAKKRDLKQAAMQQLLTGQTRLPGFHGEGELKRLGDIGTFLKGGGVKKDQAKSGDLPCIRYGEIYTHHNDYIRSFNSWISLKVAATATKLKYGDLLFAGSGETKEEIGKCVAFTDDFDAFAGGDIVILRLAGAHPKFMGYYCNTAPINAQKVSKGPLADQLPRPLLPAQRQHAARVEGRGAGPLSVAPLRPYLGRLADARRRGGRPVHIGAAALPPIGGAQRAAG